MVNKYLFFLFFFASLNNLFSQNTCPNSDFSNGNFDNWQGTTGYYSDPYSSPGIVNGRHTIITTQGFDPYSCNGLPMIPPGEIRSCRLGNDDTNSEAESIAYTIPVTNQNSLFIYKYAVVLQDPQHADYEQPTFTVRIVDNLNNVIDPSCGVYNVYSGQPNQNFQSCGDVKWLPWKTVALNLTPYIGQNIKIEFVTKDCSLGAHFGYAYLSAKCATLKGTVKICEGSTNFLLSAPNGFSNYSWSLGGVNLGNSQTLSLPVANYPIGTVFDCTLTSFSNGNTCNADIQVELTAATIITPDFKVEPNCGTNLYNGIPLTFTDLSTIQNGSPGQVNWDFGDGATGSGFTAIHNYQNPGTYNVKITVISESGCIKVLNRQITIIPNPIPTPVVQQNQAFCNIDNPTLSSMNSNNQNLYWFDSLNTLTPLAPNTPLINGVTYFCALSDGICFSPRNQVLVRIDISPTATISYSTIFCSTNTNPIFVNLNGTGNYTNGTFSAVPNGLNINSSTGQIRADLSLPGNYTVTYSTPSNSACSPYLAKTTLTVIRVATASISYGSTTFCTSENIKNVSLTGTDAYTGGTFTSSPAGLTIDSITGEINPKLSQPGNYIVTYSMIDHGGCITTPAITTVNIIETPQPTGNNFQEFCKIDKPQISDLIISGTNIKWYSDSNTTNQLNQNDYLVDGTYYATQTNPITLCESKDKLAISVKINNVTKDLTEDYLDDFCSEKKPVLSDLTIHTNNIVYFDTKTSTTQLPLSTPLVNGEVYYAAMIDPISKCESVERTAITVSIFPCELLVYNTLTLNNNQLNDYLGVKNIENFEDNELEIYNRLGQLVFKTSSYGFNNNWFRGEANEGNLYFDNKYLPTGTYYFIFKYKKESVQIDVTKKGFIYILNNNE